MAEATTAKRAPIERIGPDAIRLERVLDAPAETVWRYLTEAELRRTWLMSGSDVPPSGEFEIIIDHDQLSEDDVPYPESYAASKGKTWTEKVIRFDPPRLLETTFGVDKGVVTYELFPQGQGTKLVLTHSRITSPTGFEDFGAGWTSHLAVLEQRLAGRTVKDFWALHAQSKQAVAKALG
jgi:uncharacterized protein YndB with AHSA1/START domain